MHEARSEVTSEKAQRYLAQLCKHFAHKIPVKWDETTGHSDFGFGVCEMEAGDGLLRLTCKAPTPDGLERVKYIVEDHVVRFGWRENIAVTWMDGSDPAARTEGP